MVARRRDQRGTSAIEMAFVAPAFLLLIFAIVEVALWMHSRNVALASAREGVSELRTVAPKGAPSDWERVIERQAVEEARHIGGLLNPKAHATYDPQTHRVTVTVTGTVNDLFPGWDMDVTATATASTEDFRPDLGEPNAG
jgi:Flp pilus assembly protein TadG